MNDYQRPRRFDALDWIFISLTAFVVWTGLIVASVVALLYLLTPGT